ncbi:ROK family protein [bacterium]|nr:MAG: ROK family protein [bacterium]
MAHYLVVDVGGTKILAAALADDGRIVARHKIKTERGSREALLAQLDIALDAVMAAAGLSKNDIAGLALGVPGVVDSARGYVVLTPNAPLSETPLRELLARKWSCPIIVGNDVNVGMAGEVLKGAARGASSAFGIFVGTGIGGGLFIDGKLIEGFRGLGGEIGHLMVPLGADEISGMLTKKHTFLEDLCSRTAIENQLRYAIQREGKRSILTDIVGDKKLERIRSGALKEALKKGDPLVIDVMRRASYLLGLATASVLHVVDPEVIVFGGGVIEACGKWMMPDIEKTVKKVAMAGTGRRLMIVQSSLGDDAILLGGLALLQQKKAQPIPTFGGGSERPVERPPLASVDKPLDPSK